ncbi:hypothetical protein LINPERPRIM_LOCUS4168 [Linum perenne]
MSNDLSILIERNIAANRISGIRLTRRGPLLTHYLFADDTIVFGQAFEREADRILGVISEYGSMTGQKFNLTKSSIFFSANTPDEVQSSIITRTGFSDTVTHSKYLGVPTEWGRSKAEIFNFLIERMVALQKKNAFGVG